MRNPLDERIKEIRDLINIPRRQHILMQDLALWRILCDSMDDVQDTERALEDFLKKDVSGSDKNIGHLPAYDVLVSLVDQQEAVENLHKVLKIPYTKNSSLEKIKKICVDTKEHLNNSEVKNTFNSIDLPRLVLTQGSVFRKFLTDIIRTLRKEELEHRRKFKDKRLSSTFEVTHYWFEKIYDAIFSKDSPHVYMVGGHVDEILNSVNEFKDGLKERGEPDDNISDIYENIAYSLEHIKAYFHNKKETHIQEKDVYIFAYFALRQVRELENIAQTLDGEYSNKEYIS